MVVNAREKMDLVERLTSLVHDFDELTVGSVILPLDDLFGQIARRFRVCLLGTGGDELFGGYTRYDLALGHCPQESYRAAFDALGPVDRTSVWQRFEQLHVKGNPDLFRFYDDSTRARFLADEAGSSLEAMLAFDRRVFLEALLNIDDKIGGRHGIEGRPALLHQRFVRRLMQLRPDQLVGKRLLRRIARGVLPDAVVYRSDKMGFTTPVGTIVNANASRIREVLSASPFRDLYNLRRLTFTATTKFDRQVFGLVLLDCWLRRYA
jgi:asparagine synthase (glutamine-hydrolysing)